MPWTLYRYILKELIRLLVVAAVVLVLLVSMGLAIQALIKGLLDPSGLLKFVFYTSPSMLQFALPFAAAFAATTVFHRMATDNEIMACSAGGLGYLTILGPVLGLGLVLMLGVYYLSNTLVPWFNQRAAEVIQKDVIRYMVLELQKGRAFRHRNWVIYASWAQERAPTQAEVQKLLAEGSEAWPFRVIELRNVALCTLEERRQQAPSGQSSVLVKQEGTAPRADIFLFRQNGQLLATAYLSEVSYFDAERGRVYLERTWVKPLPIPSPLRDKPHFRSGRALKELAVNPLKFDRVRTARDHLVEALAREELLRRILAAAQEGSDPWLQVTLIGPEQEHLVLRAGRISRQGDELILEKKGSQAVRVETWRQGRIVRRFEGQEARLIVRRGEFDPEPRAHIELSRARVISTDEAERPTGRGTEHPSLTLAPLRWESSLTAELRSLPLEKLQELAWQRAETSPAVRTAARELWQVVDRLGREIIAQLNMRAAAAVSCLLLLALGAVLAMNLSGRSVLGAFLWSFLLALLSVVLIHSGRNVLLGLQSRYLAGVGVIWSGNMLLTAVLTAAYLRRARH